MRATEIINYATWNDYIRYVKAALPKMEASRRVAIGRMLANCDTIARKEILPIDHEYNVRKTELLRLKLERRIAERLLPAVRVMERMMLVAKLSQK